jgi:hypothetical protein
MVKYIKVIFNEVNFTQKNRRALFFIYTHPLGIGFDFEGGCPCVG